MSIIPQAYRLTSGDGKIPVIPKDFYPAPGDYSVAEKTSLTHELTAPHFPKLDSAAPKHLARPTSAQGRAARMKKSPALQRAAPGPGAYEVTMTLGSDLPGVSKDYHDEYDKVAGAMAHGRVKVASDFPSVAALSKTRGSVCLPSTVPWESWRRANTSRLSKLRHQ